MARIWASRVAFFLEKVYFLFLGDYSNKKQGSCNGWGRSEGVESEGENQRGPSRWGRCRGGRVRGGELEGAQVDG